MAEYTENLDLFEPGSDDNVGIETSLTDNMRKIDSKLGTGLTDRTGKEFTSLGERLNMEQEKYDQAADDVVDLKKKTANVVMDFNQFRTIAHRGFSFLAPENTLSAFRYAVDAGFFGIEMDLQLTSDGIWVICHDETVDRTSSGTGSISAMTLAQLKALDFGSKYSQIFKDERIPTLDEALMVCKLGNVVPYLELKTSPTDVQVEGLINIIRKYRMEDVAVIIGATMANLQKVRIYSDRIAIGYVTGSITQFGIDNTAALGNAFIDAAIDTATQANIDKVYAAGLDMEVYTVDLNRDMRRMAAMGVRGITTNRIPWKGGY